MKGVSTGHAPNHANIINDIINSQKISLLILKFLFDLFLRLNGRQYRIIIENNKAITPPSLLGTLRKIAYANK